MPRRGFRLDLVLLLIPDLYQDTKLLKIKVEERKRLD
jgi:hypothetical protein